MENFTNERRSEARARTAAVVQIFSKDTEFPGVLENISPSGACLYVEEPIKERTKITITSGLITRTAVVTHVKNSQNGFIVGICFLEAKWPGPITTPVHWINPGTTNRETSEL
jgi:hypothetical protein